MNPDRGALCELVEVSPYQVCQPVSTGNPPSLGCRSTPDYGGPQSQPADSQLPRYIRQTTRVLSELSLIAITTRRKPVIGTELGVGQNKRLKAMGATMRYLSH